MAREYGLVANVIEPDRVFRMGAKAWVRRFQSWDRVEFIALSRGGRKVTKISPVYRFSNFRVKWVPENLRDGFNGGVWVMGAREEMEKWAAQYNENAEVGRRDHPNRFTTVNAALTAEYGRHIRNT